MSPRPFTDPVLSLATNSIGKLDTLDVDNLSCIWTVFTKCAENLENGRRLENLSWRLWCKTVFFFIHNTMHDMDGMVFHHSSSQPLKNKILSVPELSVSVDSTSSFDEHGIKGKIANYHPPNVSMLVQTSLNKPNIVRCVSPGKFQKIITNFISFRIETEKRKNNHNVTMTTLDSYKESNPNSHEKNELYLTIPKCSKSTYSYQTSRPSNTHNLSNTDFGKMQSDTSPLNPVSFNIKDTPEFYLNYVSSHNIENHPIQLQKPIEKQDKMFFIQETFSTESFMDNIPKNDFKSNAIKSSQLVQSESTKHISFQGSENAPSSELLNTKHLECNNFSSSADNDNDWNSIYDSSSSSSNEKSIFQKIDTCLSQSQLQSRRSLLSSMLQNKSGKNLTNLGSKSSPAIALSQASASSVIPKQIHHNHQSSENHVSDASPIIISPRMIRKNMFATELSESLRRNLLRERQQRIIALGALKYQYNTCGSKKLNKFPTQPCKENYDFFDDTDYGYHAAGW
ncbi:hypothetical protein PCANB_002269 [Pneumocystis canis]|nr:hypothetical protein PCK1_002325 [Pneumocystis canis]KAG5438939.1 hypothetical protein PCANB_002269 [Pneumocystis canis]